MRRAYHALSVSSGSAGSSNAKSPATVSLRRISEYCKWSEEELRIVLAEILPLVTNGMPASASSILDGCTATPSVTFRPKPVVRGVHLFVDADDLHVDEVQRLATLVGVDWTKSTTFTVRQPGTSQHSPRDVVASHFIPSYMLIERQLLSLRDTMPVVLKDVIILCADTKVELYANHVLRGGGVGATTAAMFPDAKCFVCSPQRFESVYDPAACV